MARPYGDKGVAELERLATENAGDAKVMADVIAELRKRTVPKARKLLARLSGESTLTPATPRKSSSKSKKAPSKGNGSKPIASGPMVNAAPATMTPDGDRSTEQTFELLRETFTLEAEILARWGMTPTLPKEIKKLVIIEWRKLLKGGPDDRGRSIKMLELDMLKLASYDGSEF
jgi:hypothetical protein